MRHRHPVPADCADGICTAITTRPSTSLTPDLRLLVLGLDRRLDAEMCGGLGLRVPRSRGPSSWRVTAPAGWMVGCCWRVVVVSRRRLVDPRHATRGPPLSVCGAGSFRLRSQPCATLLTWPAPCELSPVARVAPFVEKPTTPCRPQGALNLGSACAFGSLTCRSLKRTSLRSGRRRLSPGRPVSATEQVVLRGRRGGHLPGVDQGLRGQSWVLGSLASGTGITPGGIEEALRWLLGPDSVLVPTDEITDLLDVVDAAVLRGRVELEQMRVAAGRAEAAHRTTPTPRWSSISVPGHAYACADQRCVGAGCRRPLCRPSSLPEPR